MLESICPVCQQQLSSAVCSCCGFDTSCHYERFPTLVCPHSKALVPVSSLRVSYYTKLEANQGFTRIKTVRESQEKVQGHSAFGLSRFPWEAPDTRLSPLLAKILAEQQRFNNGRKTEFNNTEFKSSVSTLSQEVIFSASHFISAGAYHSVGLKSDGTVFATGDNQHRQCHVSNWRHIVAVSAGATHTVGLKEDGTVVAVGQNSDGQCRVGSWRNIVAVCAGSNHTLGLRKDGTVLAVGRKASGQCEVGTWHDIVAVSAGWGHSVGLKSDGTVIASGENEDGQCNVESWQNIISVSAGGNHTIGLKADGTVVAVGKNQYNQCLVSGWHNIIAVSAGWSYSVGLKSNGTVLSAGEDKNGQRTVHSWRDIVAISAGNTHSLGLRADGTLLATGENYCNQCEIKHWLLFLSISSLEKRTKTARIKQEEFAEAECRAKNDALYDEITQLQSELANLKGIFANKRRKEITARLDKIDEELNQLG